MSLAELVNLLVDLITPRLDARLVELELFLSRTLGNSMTFLRTYEACVHVSSLRGTAVGAVLGIAFSALSGIDPAYAAIYGAGLVSTSYRFQCDISTLPYFYPGGTGTG